MRKVYASVLGLAVLMGGCATYRDDLNRAERHYQANENEQALALLRLIEQDWDSLNANDRVRYAYLRGMNDYRLGGNQGDGERSETDKSYRAHARYWLGLAKSMEKKGIGTLPAEWKEMLAKSLRDLNQDVYGMGVFVDEEGVTQEAEPEPAAITESTESSEPANETQEATEPEQSSQ